MMRILMLFFLLFLLCVTSVSDGSDENILEVKPGKIDVADENIYLVSSGPPKGPHKHLVHEAIALRVSLRRNENWVWVIVEETKYDRVGTPRVTETYVINLTDINYVLKKRYQGIVDIRWTGPHSFELICTSGIISMSYLGSGKFNIESTYKKYVDIVGNFSFVIPMDWRTNLKNRERLESFVMGDDSRVDISVDYLEPYSGMELTSVLESWKKSLDIHGFLYSRSDFSEYRLNGYPVIELEKNYGDGKRELMIFVKKEDEIYRIQTKFDIEDERDVRDVLESFRPSEFD